MRLLMLFVLLFAGPLANASGLAVAIVVEPPYWVPRNFTGNGAGFKMGAFDVSNPNTTGVILHDITTAAIGSGDDSAALSEIGLFIDSNGNAEYDPGIDTRYAQAFSAYAVDDGTLTFAENVSFAPWESKRFLVVGKLNGAVLPHHQDGFRTIVSAISATVGPPTGVPTTFTGGVAVFGGSTPLRLEYNVTAGGPPYSYTFRVVLDNSDGSWSAGQQWAEPIFGISAFGAASGTAPFATWNTDTGCYPVGPYTSTSTGTYNLGGVVYGTRGLVDNVTPTLQPWIPGAVGDQLAWWGACDLLLNEGEMAWSFHRVGGASIPGSAVLEPAHRVGDYLRVVGVPGGLVRPSALFTGSGSGFLIGAFDVIAHSNSSTLSGVTLAASGSGDDSLAFSDIRLFVDANGNGAFDPGVDTQYGSAFTSYPADNGSLTFTDTLNLGVNETKRLLVVAKLNGAVPASYGQTFNTTITAINATGFMHSGLPTATVPGIAIEAPALTLTTIGAGQSVFCNAQGAGGLGVEVARFLLANNGVGVANLNSITLAAAGAMFDQTDFASLGLYLDSNGNGMFDAADALYGSLAGPFPADDGSLTFTQAMTFAPNQSRLLFAVARLSGLAAAGADFWCQIAALGVSGGTEAVGVPGQLVQGLTILAGQPVLSVQRAGSVASGGADVIGNVPVGVAQTVTYTIQNTGTAPLDLTGTPLVEVIAGLNVGLAAVTSPPATKIAAGGSTNFTLQYTVAAPGAWDLQVNIASTDPASPFTWQATGTATAAGGGGGGGGGDSGGCSTTSNTGLPTWLIVSVLALICTVLHLRRRAE